MTNKRNVHFQHVNKPIAKNNDIEEENKGISNESMRKHRTT